MTLKIAAFAPMPIASVRTATVVKTGSWMRRRRYGTDAYSSTYGRCCCKVRKKCGASRFLFVSTPICGQLEVLMKSFCLWAALLAAVPRGRARAGRSPIRSRRLWPSGSSRPTFRADARRRRSVALPAPRPRRSAGGRSRREPADAVQGTFLRRGADDRLEAVDRPQRRLQQQPRVLQRRSGDHAHLVRVGRPARVAEGTGALGRPLRDVHRRRSLVPPGRQPPVVDVAEHVRARRRRARRRAAENLKYDAFELYETAYRTVRPHLFVGAGINVSAHADVRPGDGAAGRLRPVGVRRIQRAARLRRPTTRRRAA